MNKTIGALLAAGLLFASLALPSAAQESQAQAKPEIKPKSEGTAVTLALVGTFLPWGLVALGASGNDDNEGLAAFGALLSPLGPAPGYFYAGSPGRAWRGIGIRALGLGAYVAGILVILDDGNGLLATGLMLTGGCVFVASTIADLAGVRKAVRKYNAEVGGANLNVAPILSPKSKTVGLSVRLAF